METNRRRLLTGLAVGGVLAAALTGGGIAIAGTLSTGSAPPAATIALAAAGTPGAPAAGAVTAPNRQHGGAPRAAFRRFARQHPYVVRSAFRSAAAYLGLTPQQLRAQLRDGKSLAQVAAARGKTVQGVEDAILAGAVPVLMAAGGPKSAAFAGTYADGLITSVKDPADTVAKVIAPYRKAASEAGKKHLVLATRWTVLADGPDRAWQALSSMRGLRAPGRLEATDPMELRVKADEMDRAEVLASYTVVPDAQGLIDAYRPLVTDVGADIVSIQVMCSDPMAAIEVIGKEVLPELRKLAT